MIGTDDPDHDPVGLHKILNGHLVSREDLIIRLNQSVITGLVQKGCQAAKKGKKNIKDIKFKSRVFSSNI